MLDHISIGVLDLPRAKTFYEAALEPLGYRCRSQSETMLGFGDDSATQLWIGLAARPVPPDTGSGLHICFKAPGKEGVDAFHKAALATGGIDNGAPGFRPGYDEHYYAAFVIDPEGYRLEAYYNDVKKVDQANAKA